MYEVMSSNVHSFIHSPGMGARNIRLCATDCVDQADRTHPHRVLWLMVTTGIENGSPIREMNVILGVYKVRWKGKRCWPHVRVKKKLPAELTFTLRAGGYGNCRKHRKYHMQILEMKECGTFSANAQALWISPVGRDFSPNSIIKDDSKEEH